jgi:hypothetical protein
MGIEKKDVAGRPQGAALGDDNTDPGLKPQLDEHHGKDDRAGDGGLRGEDKRQAALEDSAPGPAKDTTEGLSRERAHPLNPSEGRGGPVPPHIPGSKPK